MLTDLRVTAARLDRVVASGAVRSSAAGRPLPLNLGALDAAARLRRAAGRWVAADAGRIARQPWGPGFYARLGDALAVAGQVVDLPLEWVHHGACGSVFEGVVCEQELFAEQGATNVYCEVCGTYWDLNARREHAISTAWDVLAPAGLAITAVNSQGLSVKPKDIENWVRLGHLGQLCDVATRRVVYRIADVYAVAARMAARRRKHREHARA